MLDPLRAVLKQPIFRVSEVMTPWKLVQTESASKDPFQNCSCLLGTFDYVPLMQGGIVSGVLDMQSRTVVPAKDLLVNPSEHLLDAFRIAESYQKGGPTFLLVGTARHPRGIITHADFNHLCFRIMLYTLFVQFETHLSNVIASAEPPDWWLSCLSDKSAKQIEALYSEEKRLRMDIDRLSCCYFSEKVTIIQKTKRLCSQLNNINPKALSSLVKWRNRLVHPGHPPRVLFDRKELTSLLRSMLTIEQVMQGSCLADSSTRDPS